MLTLASYSEIWYVSGCEVSRSSVASPASSCSLMGENSSIAGDSDADVVVGIPVGSEVDTVSIAAR